jgi:thiosulfate/3-mercaptopyruvate sulfurtransferase
MATSSSVQQRSSKPGHRCAERRSGGRCGLAALSPPSTIAENKIAVPQLDSRFRANWLSTLNAIGDRTQLLDVRTAAEYRGDLITPPGWPDEGAQRAGHIPTALHVPWEITIDPDGKLLPDEQLRDRFADRGVDLTRPAITYCRIANAAPTPGSSSPNSSAHTPKTTTARGPNGAA